MVCYRLIENANLVIRLLVLKPLQCNILRNQSLTIQLDGIEYSIVSNTTFYHIKALPNSLTFSTGNNKLKPFNIVGHKLLISVVVPLHTVFIKLIYLQYL